MDIRKYLSAGVSSLCFVPITFATVDTEKSKLKIDELKSVSAEENTHKYVEINESEMRKTLIKILEKKKLSVSAKEDTRKYVEINESKIRNMINKASKKLKKESAEKIYIDMNPIKDYEGYVSGCELISIVNLLTYYGYEISLDDFYNNFFKHADWFTKDGVTYSYDPNFRYPGNPKKGSGYNCGYGCFGTVVKNSIDAFFISFGIKDSAFYNKYKVNHEVVFEADAGKERIVELLNNNIPVMIWSTQAEAKSADNGPLKMKKSGGPGDSWIIIAPEASKGKKYTWIRGEHCSIINGYDNKNDSYSVCDPFRGILEINQESLDESREIFGNQIVYLREIAKVDKK